MLGLMIDCLKSLALLEVELLASLFHCFVDVKTERWRLRSDAILNSLPAVSYEQLVSHSAIRAF
jgi:hypothetical protein